MTKTKEQRLKDLIDAKDWYKEDIKNTILHLRELVDNKKRIEREIKKETKK